MKNNEVENLIEEKKKQIEKLKSEINDIRLKEYGLIPYGKYIGKKIEVYIKKYNESFVGFIDKIQMNNESVEIFFYREGKDGKIDLKNRNYYLWFLPIESEVSIKVLE